jgi:hypothetical protein
MSLVLEAVRCSEDLEAHVKAYVAHQRNDRFPLNGPMTRVAAAVVPWLRPGAVVMLADLPEDDRKSFLTTVRASVAVLDGMARLTVPRIVQAAHVFFSFDLIAQFWRRVIPFLSLSPETVPLGAALTTGVERALRAFFAAVDPFTMGVGLSVCLFWTAVIPSVTASLSASNLADISTSRDISSEPPPNARNLLLRALRIAEARRELPMAARIRVELESLG